MNFLTEVFFGRRKPRWMNQYYSSPYGYGGNAPRTELRVFMCCAKCEEKVREEIHEVDGVQEVFADPQRSEVVVYGYADSHEVVKKARKIDKKAEVMSSDSFTFHDDKHRKRHHKHDKHRRHNHSRVSDYNNHGNHMIYNGRGNQLAVEIAGSPRYNSRFNQSTRSYDSRYNQRSSIYGAPENRYRYDYRPQYRPEGPDHSWFMHEGYLSEYRPMYDEYRPEHEHRYGHNGYRPSQSYPPSYVERDEFYRYPEAITNPNYLQQIGY